MDNKKDKFFNVGDYVVHEVFGAGVITKVFLLYCEVKFFNLETERTIDKNHLKVSSSI